jgi:hypothetical protein
MDCADYEKLRKDSASEQEVWIDLMGASEGKSRKLANEALERRNEIHRQMFAHRQLCAECNRATVAIAPMVRSAKAGGSN